jgi:metallo-beta-lactamase superfamily protein
MTAPTPDQIEVTVFGPGFGECIVVHAGYNEWIIIDSCFDSQTGKAAALVYLRSIGVDPATAVKFILATHWHDDHVGGMSELVETCTSARFACSAALCGKEFLKVAIAFNQRPLINNSSGATEIYKTFKALGAKSKIPIHAIADRRILTIRRASGFDLEMTSLSPSDAEFQRFLMSIPSWFPQAGTTKFRLPSPRPNDVSVVAWIKIGEVDILLGADLEEHGATDRGWSAVLAGNRPSGRATLFKIPHHGSVTGHHERVWADMLSGSVHTVLTPWNRGSKLPTAADCSRIAALTPNAFATLLPSSSRIQFRSRVVERTIKEAGISVQQLEPNTGFARFRGSATSFPGWSVTLSPRAGSVAQYGAAL